MQVAQAKLKLESQIARQLYRLFGGYVRERVSAQTMTRSRLLEWQGVLQQLLASHYERCAVTFAGDFPVSLDRQLSWRRRSLLEATKLIASVDRLITETMLRVTLATKADADKRPGWGTRVLEKARAVMVRIKARIRAIAAAQTNGPVEEERLEGARRAAGNRQLFKRWSTMEDERVRAWHEAAEGQVQPVAVPFDVGGEALMFPGDAQLGASLKNIIKCRCSSVYFVRDDDGTEYILGETVRLTPIYPTAELGRVDHPSLVTRTVPLVEGRITRVFLSDMVEARVRIMGGVVMVSRGNQRLATGRISRGVLSGVRVDNLQIKPSAEGLGIRELIDRSLRGR
jgi:hypothetical protein